MDQEWSPVAHHGWFNRINKVITEDLFNSQDFYRQSWCVKVFFNVFYCVCLYKLHHMNVSVNFPSGESDPRRHRKCHDRCQRRQSEEETRGTQVRTNHQTHGASPKVLAPPSRTYFHSVWAFRVCSVTEWKWEGLFSGRPTVRGCIVMVTANWLICPSVCRMILKSDGVIPPPPAAPAPEPPASSNQVDVKSRVAAWSAWTNEQQDCEWCHIVGGVYVFSDPGIRKPTRMLNLELQHDVLISDVMLLV